MTLAPPAWIPAEFLRFNPRMILPMLPVVAFSTASRLSGTEVAIITAFLASMLVFMACRDSGVIRFLSVQGFVTVSFAAVIGLVLQSERVFVAENIAGDFIVLSIALGSLAIGRPFYGLLVREAMPRVRPSLAVTHPAFVQLTLLFVAMQAGTGVGRLFLIQELSPADYVIVSRVITWPVTAVFLLAVYVIVSRALAAHHAEQDALQPAPAFTGPIALPVPGAR